MRHGTIRYVSAFNQTGLVLGEDGCVYEIDLSTLDFSVRTSLRCGREITFEVSSNGENAINVQIAPEPSGLAKWLRWWNKLPIWDW